MRFWSWKEKGRNVCCYNMLIAAQALALNLILVTANEREFSRVPDLSVENWLESYGS